MSDHQDLRRVLDQIQPPTFSIGFEKKLMKDWAENTSSDISSRPWLRDILIIRRNHKKMIFAVASMLMVAAILGQQYFYEQSEDLNHVDVLSELSLSAL
jgi:hypothetical protein